MIPHALVYIHLSNAAPAPWRRRLAQWVLGLAAIWIAPSDEIAVTVGPRTFAIDFKERVK